MNESATRRETGMDKLEIVKFRLNGKYSVRGNLEGVYSYFDKDLVSCESPRILEKNCQFAEKSEAEDILNRLKLEADVVDTTEEVGMMNVKQTMDKLITLENLRNNFCYIEYGRAQYLTTYSIKDNKGSLPDGQTLPGGIQSIVDDATIIDIFIHVPYIDENILVQEHYTLKHLNALDAEEFLADLTEILDRFFLDEFEGGLKQKNTTPINED